MARHRDDVDFASKPRSRIRMEKFEQALSSRARLIGSTDSAAIFTDDRPRRRSYRCDTVFEYIIPEPMRHVNLGRKS